MYCLSPRCLDGRTDSKLFYFKEKGKIDLCLVKDLLKFYDLVEKMLLSNQKKKKSFIFSSPLCIKHPQTGFIFR